MLKKLILFLVLFLILPVNAQTVLTGEVTYDVDSARKELLENPIKKLSPQLVAKYLTDSENRENLGYALQGNVELKDRTLAFFSDGTYAVMYDRDKYHVWYYSHEGKLIYAEEKTGLDYPYKTNEDGELLIKNLSFEVNQGEKVAFIARDTSIITNLFDILEDCVKSDSGEVLWGVTATHSYFPKDNNFYFENNLTIMQWLAQYSPDQHVNFLRGYLGRMLFSGDDADKKVNVLSGGERVRCLFAKMMIAEANVMIFDEPTNHLDLESITALNNAMIDFPGTILFTSQDYQLIQTVADRIVEISPKGYINMRSKYDEYLKNPVVLKKRQEIYG